MKILLITVAMLLPFAAMAADKPIAVVALDRKEPVAYEKDVEPILKATIDPEDPFYNLTDLAESGKSLSNSQIDEILYGE